MNGEPQDSNTSVRPNIEGLRSNSDHEFSSQPPNSIPTMTRDGLRREHSDGELARQTTDAITSIPTYIPDAQPISPHQQYGGTTQQFFFPQRSDSLGSRSDPSRDEAQRRAMIRMLRQRREQEESIEALRRRSTSMGIHPTAPPVPSRHTTSASMGSSYPRSPYDANIGEGHYSRYQRQSETQDNQGQQVTEYVVPRWQPDAEVTNCPICKHAFSFFYRKHHCRRCGRVVCANCSPHRITIPRQYIVNPPSVFPIEIDLTGDSSPEDETTARLAADHLHPALGGGDEVRLCNPCVPDPNPMPPPSYPNAPPVFGQPVGPRRALPEGYPASRRRTHAGSVPIDYTQYHGIQPNPLAHRRTPHQLQPNPLNLGPTTPYGSAPDSASMYIPRYTHPRNHRHHASLSMLPSTRHRSMFDAMTTPEAPPEESPQRQIPEEDECPICHEELPPKGEDGSEVDREAHVASCIEGHFSSSRPKDISMPHPETAIAAAVVASAATPAQAGSSVPTSSIAGPSTRRRTTGMVVYQATEKDCVGEDGATQECIICFEDFEPGTEMGRLECLCKFHKACIRSWWDTKGIGACPVHQGGLI